MRSALAIAVVLLALPARGQADDAGAKAEQYFDAGRRAGDKGNLEDAISAFEAGLRYRVTAKLVIGKALAYEGLWDRENKPPYLREALALFRRALEMADLGRYRSLVQTHLDRLEPTWNKLVADGVVVENAPSPLEAAKRAFERWRALYAAGKHAEAAEAFEEAYQARPFAQFLYNIGAAHEKNGDYQKAVAAYRRYLAEAKNPSDGPATRKRIAVLEAEIRRRSDAPDGNTTAAPTDLDAPDLRAATKTEIMVSSRTPDARAVIDGRSVETGVAVELPPGPHEIRVQAEGYVTATVTETAVAGRLVVATVNLKPRSARVSVISQPGATVEVGGRRMIVPDSGELPRFPLRPGAHRIAVSKRGHAAIARLVEVTPDQALEMRVMLRTSAQRRTSYYVLGGAGVLAASAIATSIVAFLAENEAQDIDAKRGVEQLDRADREAFDDALARRDGFRIASYALLGGAAAAAIAGGALWWFDTPKPIDEPSMRVVPTTTGDGFGAAYTGSF